MKIEKKDMVMVYDGGGTVAVSDGSCEWVEISAC